MRTMKTTADVQSMIDRIIDAANVLKRVVLDMEINKMEGVLVHGDMAQERYVPGIYAWAHRLAGELPEQIEAFRKGKESRVVADKKRWAAAVAEKEKEATQAEQPAPVTSRRKKKAE